MPASWGRNSDCVARTSLAGSPSAQAPGAAAASAAIMVPAINSRVRMPSQSRNLLNRCTPVLAAAAVVLALAWFPAAAQAHNGPSDPIASSYRAAVVSVPPGTVAQVLGADQ